MLIAPQKVRLQLLGCLSTGSEDAHTAMILLPNGQLLASASVYDEMDAPEDDDEPYLDEPERLRLLAGLASQWEDGQSPKIECEVGAKGRRRLMHSSAGC